MNDRPTITIDMPSANHDTKRTERRIGRLRRSGWSLLEVYDNGLRAVLQFAKRT